MKRRIGSAGYQAQGSRKRKERRQYDPQPGGDRHLGSDCRSAEGRCKAWTGSDADGVSSAANEIPAGSILATSSRVPQEEDGMSTDLIIADKKTGEPLLDSRVAARELGIEHKNVLDLIYEYSGEGRALNASSDSKLGLLGVIRFEIRKRPGSKTGQKEKWALLTEPQALLLITMVRNTEESLVKKKQLVDAFLAMRDAINARRISKAVRRELTDALSDSGESDRTHGHAYSLYTNLVYRAVLGMDAKQFRESHGLERDESIRQHFTPVQLKAVEKLEKLAASLVDIGADYDQVKSTLERMAARKLAA